MKVECKCYGVFGLCELWICWWVMVFFWEVGVIIKEKFDGVMEVKFVMIKNYLWLVLINL